MFTKTIEQLLRELDSRPTGLTEFEATARRHRPGWSITTDRPTWRAVRLLAAQFKSPITLILIAAAVLSLFLQDTTDATIILVIVGVGVGLGFWQEFGAANALAALMAVINTKFTALRDGREMELPHDAIVPGDVVVLSAGSSIPGDCRLLEAKDLFVNEATLTGETYPVEKSSGQHSAETPLANRTNVLFQGTNVVSGTARAVVVLMGKDTQLGHISQQLRMRPPETDFESGVRRFGYFLMEVTLLLVLAIFVIHLGLKHSAMESFLFVLALAVGLTPQLLPAIISVNLAHGARRLAACDVIVRRLTSIENFGSMDVLCSDKTGTLTEGRVHVERAVDLRGQPHDKAWRLAWLNATFESGFTNPIDAALREEKSFDLAGCGKLDEIPYDFLRKRLSVLVREPGRRLLISKGAVENVLAVCSHAETATGELLDMPTVRSQVETLYHDLGSQGFRTLAVAFRAMDVERVVHADEGEMTFAGFLVLRDPPKSGITDTIDRLRELGVRLKMITGDNRVVAASVAGQVGLDSGRLLTGDEMRHMNDEALMRRAAEVDVFAEVEPNQKERIILSLKKAGHVVGYLGDGINDATALHAADVGISVDDAVDVAKEAADIVLLKRDLNVLLDGVREGRATFANTLKYVFLATSANFGNMFSMAGASLFLPFLPMLPKQILLMNLLADLPEMTIATDSVDEELIEKPRRWDIVFIRHFMLWFGILSSFFDYVTFGALLLLRVTPEQFRMAWFMESVISASLTVLVVRSRRPFFRSRPSKSLLIATLAVVVVTLILPFSPLAILFGFGSLRPAFLAIVAGIVIAYVIAAEVMKRIFYARVIERT